MGNFSSSQSVKTYRMVSVIFQFEKVSWGFPEKLLQRAFEASYGIPMAFHGHHPGFLDHRDVAEVDSGGTCGWFRSHVFLVWLGCKRADPLRWFPLQFDKESQKSVNDFNDFIKIVNSIVNNLIQSPILAEMGCKKYPKIGLVLGSLAWKESLICPWEGGEALCSTVVGLSSHNVRLWGLTFRMEYDISLYQAI